MGKYAAAGKGLSDPQTRRKVYSVVLVVFAAVIALAIALGFLEREQVTAFIDTFGWAVGILIGAVGLVSTALARNNVEPPTE